MTALRKAIDAVEAENLSDISERRERVTETLRLIKCGVDPVTVATLTRQTRSNVNHIQRGLVTAPPPAQPRPLFDLSPERQHHLATTAGAVLALAQQLRDEDPANTYRALYRLDRQALIEVAMIALAAIDIDQPRSRIFEWVEKL